MNCLLLLTYLVFHNTYDKENHFANIERKSNWIIEVVAKYNNNIDDMIINGSNSMFKNKVQYDLSKPYKTQIGTIRYVSIRDYNLENHDNYVKVYKAVLYPNRLYFFEFTNITYEIYQIHVMKDHIIGIYYSRKYENLYYKVKYKYENSKLIIITKEILEI